MKKTMILLLAIIATSVCSYAYTLQLTCTVNQIYVFSTVYAPANPFHIYLYAHKAAVATGEDDEAFCGYAGFDLNSNNLSQNSVTASKPYQTVLKNLTVRVSGIYRLELYLHADRPGDFSYIYLWW